MAKQNISVVSLFSGCGGLDLGFKWEEFDLLWANDNMKDACNTYSNNIGKHIYCMNINDVDISQIPKADVIIGGPPCQGFSGIGKRDPNDIRSALVWNYLEIIKYIQPKIFLFENVTGILSAKAGDGTKIINNLILSFKKMGYTLDLHVLNSADYGVPQRRRRVFIVGNRLGINIPAPLPTHTPSCENGCDKWISSFDAISDLGVPSDSGVTNYTKPPDCKFQMIMRKSNPGDTGLHFTPYASKKDQEIIKCVRPGGNYLDVPDHIATKRIMYFKKTGGRTTTYGRLDPKMPAHTLNTYFDRPNIGCNIHYGEDRMITIREGMRLQSFPDDFVISASNKRNYYIQVGNAVPPLLSKVWAKHIRTIFENNSFDV